MAEIMKFDNGTLFWEVSFVRGVHARELEHQPVSWIPFMVLR